MEDTRILVIFATSKTKTLWEKGCNYRLNMMEQKKYNQIDTKTPDIQSMILSYQIGGITYELSQRLDISPSRALDLFYRSKTCKQLHDKRTGLYLMSNGYVADDFILEMQGRN